MMRAGTVASVDIKASVFSLITSWLRNAVTTIFQQLITVAETEKRAGNVHNRINLMLEVVTASMMTLQAIPRPVPIRNKYTRNASGLFAFPVWRALGEERVHSLAEILAHIGLEDEVLAF